MQERINGKPMWLLTRMEDGERVYVYDVFFGKELNRMIKAGWKVVPGESKVRI